jgi:hypothetical protein
MSSVDVVDETFLAVPPARVATEFADPAGWRRFWPDLQLSVVTDRGVKGIRWTVSGSLVGSMEVWFESVLDGTVVHYYLRADPADQNGRPAPLPPRRAGAELSRRQRSAKAIMLWLKDQLEEGRPPGVAPPPAPAEPDPADNGPASNGPSPNGSASTGEAGKGPASNGPASNGPASNGPAPNGSASNGPGHSDQGHASPGPTPGTGTVVSP